MPGGFWQSPRQLLIVPVSPGITQAALTMVCHPVHACCGCCWSSGVAMQCWRAAPCPEGSP